MTAPTFRLETDLGEFSLTVVDEGRIIARAPASRDVLLLLEGDELAIQVELRRRSDGTWRPDSPDDLLLLRRRSGSLQARSEQDPHLRQLVADALAQEVSTWATDCPLLLATAAAFNRAKGDPDVDRP